jgi:hypothetical protein
MQHGNVNVKVFKCSLEISVAQQLCNLHFVRHILLWPRYPGCYHVQVFSVRGVSLAVYIRAPFIRIMWGDETFGYAEIPDNWIYL